MTDVFTETEWHRETLTATARERFGKREIRCQIRHAAWSESEPSVRFAWRVPGANTDVLRSWTAAATGGLSGPQRLWKWRQLVAVFGHALDAFVAAVRAPPVLSFDDALVPEIRDRQKSATARYQPDRPIHPGQRILLRAAEGDWAATADVVTAERMTVQEFAAADVPGHRHYSDASECLHHLREYYDAPMHPGSELLVVRWNPDSLHVAGGRPVLSEGGASA